MISRGTVPGQIWTDVMALVTTFDNSHASRPGDSTPRQYLRVALRQGQDTGWTFQVKRPSRLGLATISRLHVRRLAALPFGHGKRP